MLSSVEMMPVLIGALIGCLSGLISLSYLYYRTTIRRVTLVDTFDKTLIGLLLLSAVTPGVFLTFFCVSEV